MQKDRRGTVIVVSIWILLVLILLAVSAGKKAIMELRLLGYHLDRMRAYYLARAGLERIYLEKTSDSIEADALNESWSNALNSEGNPQFKDYPIGNGKFEVKYIYRQSLSRDPETLFGMQDERSKLNINSILDDNGTVIPSRLFEFQNLLEAILEDSSSAEELADKFADWIDSDKAETKPKGKEDYSDKGITAKNKPLDRMEELLMIDGFTISIYNKLSNYVTIYGDGAININTAPKEILMSLSSDELIHLSDTAAQDIVDYRNADDAIAATGDDHAFSSISELTTEPTMSAIFKGGALSSDDTKVINEIINKPRITVNSSTYMAKSCGTVNKITGKIITVSEIKPKQSPQQLYWYEE